MTDPAKTLDFQILETQSEPKGEVPNTYWKMVSYHFKKRKLAVFGLWITIFLFFIAIFAGLLADDKPIFFYNRGNVYFPHFSGADKIGAFVWKDLRKENPFIYQHVTGKEEAIVIWPLVKYSPTEYNLLEYLAPPDARHWFGTDDSGRDVLSRMIYGARISLTVGFVAVGIALIIGVLLGALAGYFGGWTDIVISRAIEIMLTIPTFFLIIAIIAVKGSEHIQYHGGNRPDRVDGLCAVRARRIPQAQTTRLHNGAAGSWRLAQAHNFPAHASECDGPGPGVGGLRNCGSHPHGVEPEFPRVRGAAADTELGPNSFPEP